MWTTVEGIYREGTIELVEKPPNIQESRVLVTFLGSPAKHTPAQPMRFGQFSGTRASSEEDFHIAEWRGDAPEQDGDEVHR